MTEHISSAKPARNTVYVDFNNSHLTQNLFGLLHNSTYVKYEGNREVLLSLD